MKFKLLLGAILSIFLLTACGKLAPENSNTSHNEKAAKEEMDYFANIPKYPISIEEFEEKLKSHSYYEHINFNENGFLSKNGLIEAGYKGGEPIDERNSLTTIYLDINSKLQDFPEKQKEINNAIEMILIAIGEDFDETLFMNELYKEGVLYFDCGSNTVVHLAKLDSENRVQLNIAPKEK
jgi:hypothetical protein